MLKRLKIGILALFLAFFKAYGEDISLEELELLRAQEAISQEDYEFLKAELTGKFEEDYKYSFFINNMLVSSNFDLVYRGNKAFLPLEDYLNIIDFKNYTYNDGYLDMLMGEDLQRVTVDFKNYTVKSREEYKFTKDDFYIEDGKTYLSTSLFKDIFASDFGINQAQGRVAMTSKYSLPQEILDRLDNLEKRLLTEKSKKQILFTNKRELLGLGYMRIDFDKTFTKDENGKDNDWSGRLEYQGPLLYGTLISEYDAKDGQLDNAKLRYDKLRYDHSIEFGAERNGDDQWEKFILIEKDKGYYSDGSNYVISESVPIGSRVELVYLGTTIDVQYESNGKVVFDNPEVREGRDYELRIHTPDGRIISRKIETYEDYNQQSIGEFDYRLDAKEEKSRNESDRYYIETELYYGVTNNLTLGGGYYKDTRRFEKDNGDSYSKYVERGALELVYSDYFKILPYTVVLRGEKVLTDNLYEEEDTFEGTFETKYKNFTLKYEQSEYSQYYDEKKEKEVSLDYDPFDFLWINQGYQWKEYWNGEEDNGYRIEVGVSKNIGDVLTTLTYNKDIDGTQDYSANFYYSVYGKYGIRWNNTISDKGDDLESTLSLYNFSTRNGLDYTFEISYDEEEKEKFTFRVNLLLDNWFEFDAEAKDNGHYNMSVGIDRIVDLKNITRPIDDMDSSRVKIRTFLDMNDNDILDENEQFMGNVEVEINGEKQITSSKKATYFYGVPNDVLYEFRPVVRFPGYDIADVKYALQGKTMGEIDVDIPIKPFFNISGQLVIDGDKDSKQEIYDNTVVVLKDSTGKELDRIMPDYLGYYDFSGIKVGKYIIEIVPYNNTNIKSVEKEVEVIFDPKLGNTFMLDAELKDNEIIFKK